MRRALAVAAALSLAVGAVAQAEPVVLRMATAAPPGTAWAREAKAFERDIEELTHGQVRMKWYLGGIAGDELQMLDRIKREQLDGVASGGMLCQRLAPTMRALRIVGLFQSRDESAYVNGRLKSTLDAEFLRSGFVNLGELGIGPDVVFSREPITTMAQLKNTKLWIWDLDDMFRQTLTAMGLAVVPRSLESAHHDYEAGQFDGFLAVPTGALAFQWSTQAHYYADLRPSFLRGCIIITSRAYDQLSIAGQRAVKQSGARAIAQLEELGRAQDEQLLSQLFVTQGLKRVPVSESFRAEFFAASQAAREQLTGKLVPEALLQRVLGLLADYRAIHRSVESER
ncbi:MAG: TRAP-type C4-dicarboxylate transport system, substrate-binding protein [Myxococcales bacterium]|nr:TRAP-type C4-dicarboxylate transport system, substrate-binding protein [Myxococcales bacterium]